MVTPRDVSSFINNLQYLQFLIQNQIKKFLSIKVLLKLNDFKKRMCTNITTTTFFFLQYFNIFCVTVLLSLLYSYNVCI